jgi:hypothetical protein
VGVEDDQLDAAQTPPSQLAQKLFETPVPPIARTRSSTEQVETPWI